MYISENKLLKWALCSNIIYVLFLFLVRPNGLNIQKVIITSFLLFSVISIIALAIKKRRLLKEISKFAKLLFYLIILWGIIVIIRGFSFSIQDWISNFGNVYMGLSWLTPTVLILGLKIDNWNVVFKAINFMFQLMILTFLATFFFIDNYLQWAWLLRPVNFVLLIAFYKYGLLNKIRVYIIISILIFVALHVEQRMDLLFLTLTFGFLLLDKLFSLRIQKRFLKYIIASFVIVLTLVFTIGYEFVSNSIALLIEFQDSRTFLFAELFEDLSKTNDELLGRGSLGTYFSQFFENTRNYFLSIGSDGWGDAPIRITTEVGYLQMILKGGFVMLILNVSLYLYAIFMAIFKSSNKFVKRLGYYILIITVLSLVSFRPAFTPSFILFWMAIGTVLNKKYRLMNNQEINDLIKY